MTVVPPAPGPPDVIRAILQIHGGIDGHRPLHWHRRPGLLGRQAT